MKSNYRNLVGSICLCIGFIFSTSFGFEFTHPGGFNTREELDFIKQKVNAGEEPWKSAFDKLRTNRWGRMNYSHRAFRSVDCGSHNNPNRGCNEMVYDAMAAYNQALQWYITGDQKHADKAIKILNDWASTYRRNTDFNANLVASWATPWYVNAAEIIRYTGAGWSARDITQFESMVKRLYPYTHQGGMSNNGLQAQIEAQMAVGIFLNDKKIFDKAVSEWKKYTRTYIYMKKDGPLPNVGRREDLDRAWTRTKVFLEGMAQETCRDYGHSVLGIRSMIGAATMAYTQGVDLFALEKDRIAANIELTASWLMREQPVCDKICRGRGVDCTGRNNSPKMPNCSKRGWEVAYRHLHNRLGVPMPIAKRMIREVKVEDMSRWSNKPETLTAHGIPFDGVTPGPVVSIASPQNNAAFAEPADITITAEASTEEGSITRVEFFNGSTKLGESTNSPHTYTWSDVPAGNYSILAKATNSEGVSRTASITVVVSESKGPFTGEPVNLPGTIMAVEYDKGGQGVSYNDNTAQNRGAEQRNIDFRVDENVDIDNHPDEGYVIGWIADGEWVEYTVDVTEAGVYGLEFHVASLNGGGSIGLDVGGETLLSDVDVPQTGDWQSYATFIQNVNLNAGEQVWRINMESGGFNLHKIVARSEGTNVLGERTISAHTTKPRLLPYTESSRIFYLSREADWNVYSIQGARLSNGFGNMIDMSTFSRGMYMIKFEGKIERLMLR